jgi:hypothetical protein
MRDVSGISLHSLKPTSLAQAKVINDFSKNGQRERGLWSFLTWAFLLPELIATASLAEHYAHVAADDDLNSTTHHSMADGGINLDNSSLAGVEIAQGPEFQDATSPIAVSSTSSSVIAVSLGDIAHQFVDVKATVNSPDTDLVDGGGGDLGQNQSDPVATATVGAYEPTALIVATAEPTFNGGTSSGSLANPSGSAPVDQSSLPSEPPHIGTDPSVVEQHPNGLDQNQGLTDQSGSDSTPSLSSYLGFDAYVHDNGHIVDVDLTLALNANPTSLVDVSLKGTVDPSSILQSILSLDTHVTLSNLISNVSGTVGEVSTALSPILQLTSDLSDKMISGVATTLPSELNSITTTSMDLVNKVGGTITSLPSELVPIASSINDVLDKVSAPIGEALSESGSISEITGSLVGAVEHPISALEPAGSSIGIASLNDLSNSVHQALTNLTGISVLPSEGLLTTSTSTPVMLSDHLANTISASASSVGSSLISNTTSLVNVVSELPETLGLTQTGHVSTDGSLTFPAPLLVSAGTDDLFKSNSYTDYNVALQTSHPPTVISDTASPVASTGALQTAVTSLVSSATSIDTSVHHSIVSLGEELNLRGH